MENKVKPALWRRGWFFIPLSCIASYIILLLVIYLFFPYAKDQNVSRLLLLIWVGIVMEWFWGVRQKKKV